jgi:hypothetical protein
VLFTQSILISDFGFMGFGFSISFFKKKILIVWQLPDNVQQPLLPSDSDLNILSSAAPSLFILLLLLLLFHYYLGAWHFDVCMYNL